MLRRNNCYIHQHRLAYAVASITALLLTGAGQVLAQQPKTEEITVTGSRISRDIGFESPVPVTALSSDELSMFDPGLGVSAQLEQLPQFANNVSSDNIANRVTADVGQSQLNMRGLGGNRTLVMLDGMRIVPSDRRSSVSVDYLPTSLMKRVDVVTGGASAAYGSDALAGVTNFILDRKYTGLDFNYTTGINGTGDGEFNRASMKFGDDFMGGRLHVIGSLDLRVNDAFRRENAEWDQRAGYVKNPAYVSAAATPNVPYRLTSNYVYSTNLATTGLILQTGSKLNMQQFTEAGTSVFPFDNGAFSSIPGQASTLNTAQGYPGQYQYDEFIKGHPQSLERVGVRATIGFLGADFALTDNIRLWGNALWGRTDNQPEPSSSGANGTGLGHAGIAYMTLFNDNPYLPASVKDVMAAEKRTSIRVDQHGYLGTDFGINEKPQIDNSMVSLSGGFDASLKGDWNLKGSYQGGVAWKHNENIGWERLDRFYLATDVVTDPANGQPICRIKLVQQQLAAQGRNLEAELGAWAKKNTAFFRGDLSATTPGKPEPVAFPISVDSIDNTISGCVPVNMLGRGLQSKAAIDYIGSSRSKTGVSTQKMDFAELVANGTLWQGWGAGPVSLAVGGTYRKSSVFQYIVDDAIDNLGAPCNVTLPDGTVAVRGVAPGISCAATSDNLHRFSGQPEFTGGIDVKELFAETIVPLFKADKGPQRGELDLATRYSSYSRAGDFVTWKAGLSVQMSDDVRLRATRSRDMREGSFEELFVSQGRGANINDPVTGQSYTSFNLTGGNLDLKAEQALTNVIGIVYKPSFIEGLSMSLDRFTVNITDAIGNFTEQQTVDACFKTKTLCEYITRGADGLISTIRVQFINVNQAKVSGYDAEVSYHMEPNFFSSQKESLRFRLIGGYMAENSSTPLNSPKIDQAGSPTLPKTMITANLMYSVGEYSASVQQIFQSHTVRNVTWVAGVDVDDNTVPSVNLTDLALFWTPSIKWRASFNITNLFDRAPVIAGLTRVGDEMGRRYSLGVNYSFR